VGYTIDLNIAGVQNIGDGSSIVNFEALFVTGGSGNDSIGSRTSNANDGISDVINGGGGNDTIVVGGGLDTADGGSGDDLLIADWSTDNNSFSNSGAFITDSFNTHVNVVGIERFDLRTGSGQDNVTLGSGDDSASMGLGNDTVNTLAGKASVDGGGGTDRWAADLLNETVDLTLDLNAGAFRRSVAEISSPTSSP
jgi:hypothetical protein